MTSNFTISKTIDQAIIKDLTVEFDDYRSRIAHLSVDASSVLTGMFSPLGPDNAEPEVIDIDAIEWEQYELELVPAVRTDAPVYELSAAA